MSFSKKRFAVLGMILAILLQMLMPMAVAADAAVYASDYIVSTDYQIYQNSSGTLSIYFEIWAQNWMKQIGVSKIVIERKDGSNWVEEKTYYSSSTSGLLTADAWVYDNTITYSGVKSGCTYRAKITFYVSTGSDSDSKLTTTTSVTIK